MELHLADKVTTIPQMRHFLAVKGYQGLRRRIESDVKGKRGLNALRAMADAMRSFAVGHPGLSAATFRSPTTDSPEWRQAHVELSQTAFRVFAELALEGEPAQKALRMLRSLIRGFVSNEKATSFLVPLDYERSFQLTIDAFIMGLPVFKSPIDRSVT
jgi:hypothetical protein